MYTIQFEKKNSVIETSLLSTRQNFILVINSSVTLLK